MTPPVCPHCGQDEVSRRVPALTLLMMARTHLGIAEEQLDELTGRPTFHTATFRRLSAEVQAGVWELRMIGDLPDWHSVPDE